MRKSILYAHCNILRNTNLKIQLLISKYNNLPVIDSGQVSIGDSANYINTYWLDLLGFESF